jgi:hypothetical protein
MKSLITSMVFALSVTATEIPSFLGDDDLAPLFDAGEAYNNTEKPVIGLLTQPLEDDMKTNPIFDGYNSYVMAAYVKYMEAAGARVVPLIHG